MGRFLSRLIIIGTASGNSKKTLPWTASPNIRQNVGRLGQLSSASGEYVYLPEKSKARTNAPDRRLSA